MLVIIFICSVGVQSSNPLGTVNDFKVYLYDSKYPDKQREKFPIIKYSSENGYEIYRIERISESSGCNYRIVLDKNNNPIMLNNGDRDYLAQVKLTLSVGSFKYFISKGPQQAITLGFFTQSDGLNPNSCSFTTFYAIDVKQNYKNINGNHTKLKFNDGSITYIDDLFQIEWRELNNSKYKITRSESINPDQFTYSEIPGLPEILSTSYKTTKKYAKGYLSLSSTDKKYSINGQQFTYNDNSTKSAIVNINNSLYIDMFFLCNALNCEYERINMEENNKKYTFRICRLYKEKRTDVKVIDLYINDGQAYYKINNDEGSFKIKPIWNNHYYVLLVPLREFCSLIKANILYRPLDKSILISRFIEN
jgi:hypothetical protein